MNSFTFQIAMLAMPGLIWAMVDSAFQHKSQRGQFEFLVKVLVFGVLTYAVVGAVYYYRGYVFNVLQFGDNKTFNLVSCLDEVAWSIATSSALSFIWIAGRTYKIPYRIARVFRVSNYIGDIDIWEYIFNAKEPESKYVNYRDFSSEITYSGNVVAFSDGPALREMVLADVKVYDFDGNFLYDMPRIYLARKPDDITLEFPVT